jgi:hypothetical protein
MFLPRLHIGVLVTSLTLFATQAAWACKTPVYRYAMYNWEPTPYRVYYLYDGKIAPADTEVHRLLTGSASDALKANVELHLLDVRDPAAVEKLPMGLHEEATAILRTQGTESLPRYAAVTPHQTMLHAGALSATGAKTLVDSPVRTRLAALLAGSHSGVFLLVCGADEAATNAAEQTVKAFLGELADGKVDLHVPPPPDAQVDPDEPDPVPPTLKLELIKIARDDPQEKWLVESLMHVESELAERTDPMVFLIYGRGRAHLPSVGKGIAADELAAQARFILGACSCTVKRENPGLDLLIRADWKSVALEMAQRYGAETGNEHLLGGDAFPELFPNIVDAPPLASQKTPNEKTVAAAPQNSPTPPTARQDVKPEPAPTSPDVASTTSSEIIDPRDVWRIAAVGAAVLVAAMTVLALVARRHP